MIKSACLNGKQSTLYKFDRKTRKLQTENLNEIQNALAQFKHEEKLNETSTDVAVKPKNLVDSERLKIKLD